MPTYEKDGYILRKHEGNVEGSDTLDISSQVRLHFVVHIGGGFGDKAITEEEDMYVRIVKKNDDGTFEGSLCGISMSSDRLQPDQKVLFSKEHVSMIKTKEMIRKEQEAFGICVDKQAVVEKEREEYYEKMEKDEEEKKKKELEEQQNFMASGGFFFGTPDESETPAPAPPPAPVEDPNISGEKRKREGGEVMDETESAKKKRKID